MNNPEINDDGRILMKRMRDLKEAINNNTDELKTLNDNISRLVGLMTSIGKTAGYAGMAQTILSSVMSGGKRK